MTTTTRLTDRIAAAVNWLRAGYTPAPAQGHVALVALCGNASNARTTAGHSRRGYQNR
jgi:hypothetical protein